MNSLGDFQVGIHSLRVSSVDGGPIRQSQAKRYNSLEIITKIEKLPRSHIGILEFEDFDPPETKNSCWFFLG